METSLHHELKRLYADSDDQTEVRVGRYRVDALSNGELVEIQHGGLGAIRDKIRTLLSEHDVRVVKPLILRKQLVKLKRRDGRVVGRRLSPKKGCALDLFDDLVHFTQVFPHPRLTLDVLLVNVEEWRYPGHGRRRYRRPGDFQVQDQILVDVEQKFILRTAADLMYLLSDRPRVVFTTIELAQRLGVQRSVSQKIAYCFRKMGTTKQVGKRGNSLLYKFATSRRRAA